MAKSLNKVMLIGNLGKDPELRYTTSGIAVATFTIATNESWKDQEGNLQERTEWHNIVAWRKLAEICGEWLKKGKKVYIEGRLQTRSYDDKNGVKKYVTEIVADDMLMLDSAGGRGGENFSQSKSAGDAPSQSRGDAPSQSRGDAPGPERAKRVEGSRGGAEPGTDTNGSQKDDDLPF